MAREDQPSAGPEYDYYDAMDEEEEGGRGPVLAVVALIVLAAFAGVVWVAYREGVRAGQRSAPPILRADTGPDREVPADPGGRVFPDQEKGVFGVATGSPPKEQPERLLPKPEEPLKPPPATSKAAPPAPPEEKDSIDVATIEDVPPSAPPTVPPPPEKPAATPSSPAEGDYAVQIGAYRSRDEALEAWKRAQGKHDGLGVYSSDIIAVDLGAKGVYHRLRFGPFGTREAAVSECESLRSRGQDCLVVKR